MKILGLGWIGYRLAAVDYRIRRFCKEKGSLAIWILAHLARVLRIIATNTEYPPNWKPSLHLSDSDARHNRWFKDKGHQILSRLSGFRSDNVIEARFRSPHTGGRSTFSPS